ncbi:hypothetical protein VTN00DRAFT_6760 [Thermoascus crustaceus]|uniref:uncharacterized protein n=1 Tax=Thermoascus crustaceus TaxID=5088 RepID=UPI003743915D
MTAAFTITLSGSYESSWALTRSFTSPFPSLTTPLSYAGLTLKRPPDIPRLDVIDLALPAAAVTPAHPPSPFTQSL